METKVLLAMFVFITTDISMSAARLDIKEFVRTSEKIWTVKTTNRVPMKCEVDQKTSIKALSIVFQRSSFIRGRRRDLRLRGVFDMRYKRRMTLFYRGSFISTETMVYMDPDKSCAVFKIESLRDWDISYYDLRVTNASVTSRPRPSCPHYFDRLKGFEPSFILYTPQCQQIIRAEK
uniref:Lipocalin n=1 Tax=Rhipicephalus zambeziensis TaxID=60191 RepID=A0A224YMS2_9ACAR